MTNKKFNFITTNIDLNLCEKESFVFMKNYEYDGCMIRIDVNNRLIIRFQIER